jgi:phage FluMu gp28-like protein
LPNTGDIEFEPYYAQQVLLADTSRWRIENKMRQGGFTTAFSAGEAVHSMLYKKAPEIIVLSKSQDEAVNFLDKFYLAYQSVKDKEPNYSPLTVTNTKNAANARGGKIRVLTSSKQSGRSFSATDMYFDEMAHTQYAKQIYEASYPTISRTGGRITGFSSPDTKAGKFYDICENHKDMGYSYHQFEWWFVPFYNPYYKEFMAAYFKGDRKQQAYWIEQARTGVWYQQTFNAIGELAFLREYECSFDAGEDNVFNTRQLSGVFVKNYLERDFDQYGEVWQMPEIDYTHDFVTYTDYGRKRDPLVSVTFDTTIYPAKLVEYKRIRPSIFDFAEVKKTILETIQRFSSDAYHDGTGNGDVLTAFLEGWSSPVVMGENGLNRQKTNMVEKLKLACDTKAIMIPKIAQIEKEFKSYRYNDKKLVQDCVMAIGGAVDKFFEPADELPTVDSQFSYMQGMV